MAKALAANCTAGVVTIDGIPLPSAEILSEGVGASQGVAVIDEETSFYVANTTPDLKTLLERLISVLEQITAGLDKAASALTTLDTTGFLIAADAGVPSGPVAASDISGISSASTQLVTLKTQIDALKGALK